MSVNSERKHLKTAFFDTLTQGLTTLNEEKYKQNALPSDGPSFSDEELIDLDNYFKSYQEKLD